MEDGGRKWHRDGPMEWGIGSRVAGVRTPVALRALFPVDPFRVPSTALMRLNSWFSMDMAANVHAKNHAESGLEN